MAWENNFKGKWVGIDVGRMGTARNGQKSENGGNVAGKECKSFVGQLRFKNEGGGSKELWYNGEMR